MLLLSCWDLGWGRRWRQSACIRCLDCDLRAFADENLRNSPGAGLGAMPWMGSDISCHALQNGPFVALKVQRSGFNDGWSVTIRTHEHALDCTRVRVGLSLWHNLACRVRYEATERQLLPELLNHTDLFGYVWIIGRTESLAAMIARASLLVALRLMQGKPTRER